MLTSKRESSRRLDGLVALVVVIVRYGQHLPALLCFIGCMESLPHLGSRKLDEVRVTMADGHRR